MKLNKSFLLGILFFLSMGLLFSENEKAKKYSNPFLIKKLEFQEINEWYYLYLRTSINDAKEKKADLILLELDSPGGRVDTALKIVNLLQGIDADLVIYINDNAISAGALISLVAPKIYINDGGVIGASTPVFIKEGQMQKAPEKSMSMMRSKFRSLAEKNGRPVRVCEAMVDDDIILTEAKDGYALAKGKLLTLTQDEAIKLKVCDKKANSLDTVAKDLGFESINDFAFYEITSSLKILDLVSNQAILGVLMTVGLLGLMFEARTPGWGVGGTIGVLSLSAFFFVQVSLGNADWRVPGLFFMGVMLIGLELFVIPGFGLPGLFGIVSIVGALFLSFGIDNWQVALATVTFSLVSVIVVTLLGFRYLPNTSAFSWMMLEKDVDAQVSVEEVSALKAGAQGLVLTDLRPVGRAEVNGEVLEVITRGEYIEAKKKIEIVKISGNQVFVRAI